jgi:1-aminocyclopropane-1-carboxylate deaminase/D-cysteine desulfhydrase-like pyridoxal-dependent ACC family enzyme
VIPARFPLAVLPTPVHRLRRLERALDVGPLLVKRDDLIGFGVAGNKARPLEYLLGAARAERADVLVTGGGPGSNFLPAAALAARAAGLDCELIVWGADLPRSPNLALAAAAGAVIHPTGGTDRAAVDALAVQRADELRRRGRRPFPVPRGGSTPVGALGFAAAARELLDQLTAPPGLVVIAVGSGGSCAGLLAGLAGPAPASRVLAVSVSRPPGQIGPRLGELADACAALLGGPPPLHPELLDARGAGFGTATAHERELARLALHAEGLLLDHTYGAPAFAAAVDRLRAGEPGPVLYWHTGGLLPAVAGLPAAPTGGGPAPEDRAGPVRDERTAR